MEDDEGFNQFVAHLRATPAACQSVSHTITASTSILSGIASTYIGFRLASEGIWYGSSIAAVGVSVIHHGWTYACKIDLSKTRGHPDSIRIMEKTLFGTILTIMGLLTAPSSLGVASPLPNVSDTFLVCGSFQLAACDYQIHSLSRQTSNLLSLPLADLCLHFQEVSAQAAPTG